MRYGLLLTAVATVTLPGLLAMTAVLAHEHVAAEAGFTAAALDSAPLSTALATATTTARPSVRDDVAGVQRASGATVTVFSSVATGQQAMGTRLLDLAANASVTTSFQGTELVSESGVGGSVKLVSQVWHQGGGQTFVQTADDGAAVATTDPVSDSPAGVFGVTKDLVSLLSKHYVALYWGSGSVVGRPASVVELYRTNGSMAARYWLDSQTMLPLRRELFDMSGKVISEDSFAKIQFGALTLPPVAGAAAPQPGQPESAWGAAASPASFLASLTRQGWQVPAASPGGLPLYAAASTMTASGEVVDLEYSDGLYTISLFVQRGTLAQDMPGWTPVLVSGQQAFVSGHSVTWAGLGFVYTVIADAPPQTVTQVVRALSGSGSPGVLGRFGRGFTRLAHLINPFG
jgi:sigma-E factor negative regulatory protein RseB